jgi:hypothetical protein
MSGEISVVHLVYVPFGIDLFQRFLDSYIQHAAGAEHKLVIMFNGFDDEEKLNPFLATINSLGLSHDVLLSREKWDISSYFFAAKNLSSEYLLFLNSYSMILADDWLKFYSAALGEPNVGVVGATGAGWRSEFENYLERLGGSRVKHLKSLLFMRLHFSKFHGPHLRTNAFFVRRRDFLSLTYDKPLLERPVTDRTVDSKNRTVYFEHGDRNMTYQLARRGLRALVIDRHGNSYEPREWPSAKTFWIADQENLLIHDNRTLKYQNGDEQLRRMLSYEAWGIKSGD